MQNINNFHSVNRISYLEMCIQGIEDYKKVLGNLNTCLEEVKNSLPAEKRDLMLMLDDLYTEVLMAHENFFYENGVCDGVKSSKYLQCGEYGDLEKDY